MWVIGVAIMALLCLLSAKSGDELFMLLKANRFVDDVLVIPGAILTIITAIIYGACTNWGFFKHRWITVKWTLSILIIIIGTFFFSPLLDETLTMASVPGNEILNAEIESNMRIIFAGGVCQGSMLIFLVVISVLKPWKTKKK